MRELDQNADSVNYLIKELCYSQIKQYGLEQHAAVGKLKAQAYEILLKKSQIPIIGDEARQYDDMDAQRLLDMQVFSAKLKARTHPQQWAQFLAYKEQLAFVSNESYFQENPGRAILQFLLMLQNNETVDEELQPMPLELLVPAPFTLHSMHKSSHYPTELNQHWLLPAPKRFKGVQQIKADNDAYLPKFFHASEPNQLAAIEHKFSADQKDTESQENWLLCDMSNLNLHPRAFRLPAVNGCIQQQQCQGLNDSFLKSFQLAKRSQIVPYKKHIQAQQELRYFCWSWESLGCFGIPKEKLFVSESQSSLHLKTLTQQSYDQPFQAKIMSLEQFMQDLKALTVGIQSDIFSHDDAIIFHMQTDITITGVLPATIRNYIEPFLECGTCYKRLKTMIMKRDYKFMFEGFMFRALCSALDEYLCTFHQFVFAKKDKHLIEFCQRMKKNMQQMRNLSFTFGIHPDDTSNSPPMGSHFLGYIYREILRSTERDFITLLMFVLKRCCHVYFKYLQAWIYKGILDDPCNELFICFTDHYRPQTKCYYDKAHFLRKEAVPGFFQTYEDQILQCGKYTMLLKNFKPNHALFNLPQPDLNVCLTFEEIQNLEAACMQYKQLAQQEFYEPISVKQMFTQRDAQKNSFLVLVNQRARETLDKWLEEQHELAVVAAAQKRKIHDELTAQLEDVRMRKVAARRASVEHELKCLREAEALEEERWLDVNINLRKRIEYYQELHELLKNDKIKDGAIKDSTIKHDTITHDEIKAELRTESKDALTPETKTSASTNDYHSCLGDEDEEEDIYSECLSVDFVRKFAETEQELNVAYPNIDENSNATQSQTYKRSISDIDNCNEHPVAEEIITADAELTYMQQNKINMLSGFGMQQCLEERVKPSEKSEYTSIVQLQSTSNTNEAQRNKLRVLTQEYGLTPDLNSNVLLDVDMTDMQRNRKRMMANISFSKYYKERDTLKLDLDSDLQRNRRKVLESEFGMSLKPLDVVEPMSTTSDAPIVESMCNIQQQTAEDATNNNNNNNVNIENVEIAIEHVNDEVLSAEQEQEEVAADLYEASSIADDTVYSSEHISAYKRCEELLKSNFKCASRSPHMRLNTENYVTKLQQAENSKDVAAKQNNNLNIMSAITLTDFLQKSVIIPMQTHLELVNNEVLRMFLVDLRLIEHFRSLRHYFFLMDGEFASIVCDNIIQKMEDGAQPNTLLNYQTLHGILEIALGSSLTGNNKNAENLSFIVQDIPESFDLHSPNALFTLTLSYHITWPLNLILNPETVEQYSNIFKYLLKVRRISWVLERVFHILKQAVNEYGKDMLKSPQYRRLQQMRHKLYHFVHALQNHITANALQASWKTFKDDLMHAKTIEEIYRKHTNYVKRILFLCMLNRKSVNYLNTIENIFKLSLRFYHTLKSKPFKLAAGDEYFVHPRYSKLLKDELEFDKCLSYVIYLGNKIVRRGYQEEIGEFISLINFNNFYEEQSKNQLEKTAKKTD